MAYFRTVLVLVQVLSVLADEADFYSAVVDIPEGSALGGDDYYGEEPEFKDCEKVLRPLNENLQIVFGKMDLGVTFKMDCHEVDAADVLLVGGYARYDEKTHFNLHDNITKLENQDDVKNWVADSKNQWKDVLQAELEKAKFVPGSEVYFGCSYGKAEVLCFFRNPGVDIDKVGKDLAKLEEELKKKQLKEESSPEAS